MNCYSLSQNTGPHRPRPATVIAVIALLSLNALVSAVHVLAAVTTSRDAIVSAMMDSGFGENIPPEDATFYTATVAVNCGIQAAFWLGTAIAAYRGHDDARYLSLAFGVPLSVFGVVFDGAEGVLGIPQTALTAVAFGIAVLVTSMVWSGKYRHHFSPPHPGVPRRDSSVTEWSS